MEAKDLFKQSGNFYIHGMRDASAEKGIKKKGLGVRYYSQGDLRTTATKLTSKTPESLAKELEKYKGSTVSKLIVARTDYGKELKDVATKVKPFKSRGKTLNAVIKPKHLVGTWEASTGKTEVIRGQSSSRASIGMSILKNRVMKWWKGKTH